VKVAAIQMVSAVALQANLDTARGLLEQAARTGAQLAVLPENFCLMAHGESGKLAVRESFGDGAVQGFLAQAARDLGLWIAGGTLPLVASDDAHVSNTLLVFSPAGECIARYDKIHLFKFDDGRERHDESRVIERGRDPVAFDLRDSDRHLWRVGLSVCYDLRFPELYRAMGRTDIIVVPAAFTETTGRAHWEALIRARAIENLAYVLAPAQGGYHLSGRETHGHSMIVDPWGVVVDRLPRGSGVVIAGVNPSYQASLRESLPALEHRVVG
jgi:nitrilase